VSCSGRGESYETTFDSVDNVTYLGCLALDHQQDDRLLLSIVEAPPPEASAGQPVAPASQSTTVNGPWVGTRQVELVGDQREAIGRHTGGRVRVSGQLEAHTGSTGHTDQLQHARGAEFRRLQVSSFEPVEGSCAADPRQQPAAPAGSHP
jgi:hypothetical protein